MNNDTQQTIAERWPDASPRPWAKSEWGGRVSDSNGLGVADILGLVLEHRQANAALIVHAVNTIEALGANARLIAAAPDMLEALYSMLNIEGPATAGADSKAWLGLDIGYHFDKVRAAIKAATA